jgi:hypothetical protein
LQVRSLPGAVGPDGSETDFSYDANGNLVNDGTYKYIYDAENRFIEVTEQDYQDKEE